MGFHKKNILMEMNWKNLLTDKGFLILVFLNLLVSVLIFMMASGRSAGDELDYINLAKSIISGEFSSFAGLENQYPNNIRTPGYPIFLASILQLSPSILVVKISQLILHFISLGLWVAIFIELKFLKRSLYFFLCLTGVSIQLSYYSAMVMPETLAIFLMSLLVFLVFLKNYNLFYRVTAIAFALALLTLIKPINIFLPLLFLPLIYCKKSMGLRLLALSILVFSITLSPWIIWNIKNHNVASPMSAQGSPILLYTSFWTSKLPNNFKLPKSMYAPRTYDDIFNPYYYLFTEEEKEQAKVQFLKEIEEIHLIANKSLSLSEKRDIAVMDSVDGIFKTYLTEEQKEEAKVQFLKEIEEIHLIANKSLSLSEKRDIAAMDSVDGIFTTYPSDYVQDRDALFMKYFTKRVMNEPLYYIGTRIYTFPRLFFAGINPNTILGSNIPISTKLQALIIFIVPFFLAFITFISCSLFVIKNFKKMKTEFLIIYLIIFYTTFIHMPFPVQSRYSIPIHLAILFLFIAFKFESSRVLESTKQEARSKK